MHVESGDGEVLDHDTDMKLTAHHKFWVRELISQHSRAMLWVAQGQ